MAQAPRPAVAAKAPPRSQRVGRAARSRRPAPEEAQTPEEAPAPVDDRPVLQLLIAENSALADAQAQHEWGWKKGKQKLTWLDGAGNVVRYCPDLGALKLAAQASRVHLYLGHRWYAAFPSHLVERLIAEKQVLRLPDPAPDAPA